MTASTHVVLEHVAALGAWDGVDVARMPADEALLAVELGAKAMAALQGLVARFAARVDAVCEQSPGMNGYARRHGYASGPALVSAVSGLAPGEVQRMTSLGRGLLAADAAAERAERDAQASVKSGGVYLPSTPELAEPPRELAPGEYLARAVDAGSIGTAHAEVVRATLADFTIDSRAAEREFVDLAQNLGLRKLKQHCFWRLGELDPMGLANREQRHVRERFVTVTDGPDGMIHIAGRLPVVNGATLKTLLDAMTSAALRRQRKLPTGERVAAGQLCADALTDVALHALTCEAVPHRPKTTVVVRIDERALIDDLREVGMVNEAGLASCDGTLQPVTAATARLMAVQAEILPAVMGGESLPLDLGRMRRLFTKAQHLAMIERDRGCIRCAAPPVFCHGHHVRFWTDDGPTDLANAVTLCTGCHHRLHEQRWERVREGDRFVVRSTDPERDPASDSAEVRRPSRSERHGHVPAA